MKQLAGTDSLFLSLETPEVHGHVGGLILLDPSEAPDFGFERLAAVVAERMPLAPKFTWRLQEVPLGLDRPYWTPDPNFDVARHLHRIAVPTPGGMRELADLCGYLFSHKLDRRRPLWEMWYIEGLAEGRVAIFAKTHHCLADGVAGADLATVLCDIEPNPAPRAHAAPLPDPAQAETSSDLSLLLSGIGSVIATPLNVASYAVRSLRRGLTLWSHMRGDHAPPSPLAVPRLPFNGQIGPRRGFACASVPLADLQQIRRALSVKLNDVVVELSSSAMRRYLEVNGHPVEGPMVVACPVSTRVEGDEALGNRVANMLVGCANQIEDPVERLLQIHQNANAAKEMTSAIRATPIPSIGDTLPPALINLVFRTALAFADTTPLPTNAVVSNVAGPPIALYVAGARIAALYPMSILASGQGLNVTVLSNMDRVDFGFTVDPDLVPDPWQVAEQIPLALEALQAALRDRGLLTPEVGGAKRSVARVEPEARERAAAA